MYFCGYFVLINGKNCEVDIIPIFGILFGKNVGIYPPGNPILYYHLLFGKSF